MKRVVLITLFSLFPLVTSRPVAMTSAAVGGISAVTFSAALYVYKQAQQNLIQAKQQHDTQKIAELTQRITWLKRIIYISGITTLLGAGTAALTWPYKHTPPDTEEDAVQHPTDEALQHKKTSKPSQLQPDTSQQAPATAEVKTYEPANPHVCELMGFRPPEKPSMAGMTREDIELSEDEQWYIRDFYTLDVVARKMKSSRTLNFEAMQLLGLTPIPPGKAHPTLFVSGGRSHCPIQTSCPWLRCDCVQTAEFRHLNKDTLYTAYHLVLIMWLHFAQGISLDIIHEWREAEYPKPMRDIHYKNTMKVVRTISELSHDPEKQERCIRIVFDELINR